MAHIISPDSPDFTVEPSGNTFVPLNQMTNVTFHCNVSSGVPFWSVIPDPSMQIFLSTQDNRDVETLNRRGIFFSIRDTFANITIPGVAENNGTVIYCGRRIHGSNEFGPNPITLTIIGNLKRDTDSICFINAKLHVSLCKQVLHNLLTRSSFSTFPITWKSNGQFHSPTIQYRDTMLK